ncbi:hypothetical protein MKW92_006390 [Papaver armeniacum]|nr:hypothetical protein MKW92_006390 [Papaver armeniacum]
MEGILDDKGVNYRTLEELFRISEERSNTMRYDIFVSMLEVYNERIRDLLVDESNQHPRNVHNTVEVWELLQTGSRNRAVGSINCSECVGRTEVEGERLKESQFINRSLFALGDSVIDRNKKIRGGDCKTLMFVHISPSFADSGETLCSLNFASRVRGNELKG